jgi:hypothetical protein
LPNHNIGPAQIANWTKGWTNKYNTNEHFYADPLVYTPSGFTHELVILVSNQNIVRIVDGIPGALIQNRTLDAPFASIDSQCTDIKNSVGITSMFDVFRIRLHNILFSRLPFCASEFEKASEDLFL